MAGEKLFDSKNQIWFEKDGDIVRVGFTNNFLAQMDECWHILPAGKQVKEKDPLMAVETNDGLLSIRSPATGYIMDFSDKAMNFPDKLTAEDVVVCVNGGKKPAEAAKIKKTSTGLTLANVQLPVGGFEPMINFDERDDGAIAPAQQRERRPVIIDDAVRGFGLAPLTGNAPNRVGADAPPRPAAPPRVANTPRPPRAPTLEEVRRAREVAVQRLQDRARGR